MDLHRWRGSKGVCTSFIECQVLGWGGHSGLVPASPALPQDGRVSPSLHSPLASQRVVGVVGVERVVGVVGVERVVGVIGSGSGFLHG